MSPTITVLGVAALIGGLLIVLRALLAPSRSRRTGNSDAGYGRDNQRFDVRFGVILLITAAILLTPHFFGLEYRPVTLAVLGFFFFLFVIAYSRCAKQMSAPRPERYTELVSAVADFQPAVTSPTLRT